MQRRGMTRRTTASDRARQLEHGANSGSLTPPDVARGVDGHDRYVGAGAGEVHRVLRLLRSAPVSGGQLAPGSDDQDARRVRPAGVLRGNSSFHLLLI